MKQDVKQALLDVLVFYLMLIAACGLGALVGTITALILIAFGL